MSLIRSAAEFDRWCELARRKPFPQDVTTKPWKPTRSNEQNNYLWGVCYATLAPEMGYDPEDMHEWFCGRMFGWKDVKVPKTPRNPEGIASVPIRTTTRNEEGKSSRLNKQQFAEFVDMVHRVAAHVGVFIPSPEAA